MPYNDSHHVVKTSAQWDERAIEFWVVPRGCLCVELTPEGKTKIKIGEGNKFYSQLPYVNDMSDLENYYTKEEVDNIVKNINLMAIRSTDEYDTKNDLPSIGNKLGDVRFVKSPSPSIKTDPDIYLWNGSRWIYVGYELQDIDLSQYLKKDEFHELFDPIREKVEEMYPKMHTHENKNILDRIEEPYSTAEKEKLAGLENYDDTEIRELIAETGHTHPNKPILDTITDDSLWSESDRTKFESLHNYDDTGVRNRLTDLESAAHTHSNKNILDQVTAAFTVEDKTKLDSLHNNEVFIGTDGMYGGREGLVPAPTIIDAGKFLCADGTWKAAGEIVYDFRGATASEDGTNGLVPAPMAGEQSYYLKGDGTWAKIKQGGDKYKAGDGIFILSGEVISDTFPFKAYSKSGHLSQYIIYGNTGGVGESMGGGVYGVNISITDEHGNTNNTSIILPEKISFGDYIDYEKQVFVHMRTNVSSLVNTVDPNYRYRWAIRSNGNISPTDVGAYGESPQVTTLVELEPGTTYELYHACTYPAFSNYMNLNVYDVDQNRTRTMNFYDSTGKVPTIIALGPNEKYIRLTWEHADWYPNTLIKVKAVETPTTLPQIPLFPNSINTINVTNTIKPAEIYVEVAEPSEDDPDDPMSDFTGIIYNDGVLDITQEDPNALNELTVHFRDDVDKTITIPSASVMEGATDQTDGEEGLVPAPLAGDENKFLKGDGTWSNPPTYTLPVASDTTLGGVIVSDGLSVANDGTLSVNIGEGLEFNAETGAIDVLGSGGSEYIEGQGIEFETVNVSNVPVEYTQVEYIGNTGGSYILTDYSPTTTTSVEIVVNVHKGTSSWQTIFGARDGFYPGGNEYAVFGRINNTYNFYPRITGNQNTYMAGTYDEKITIAIVGTVVTVTKADGSSYSYTQTGSLGTLINELAIFALHHDEGCVDPGIVDLYSFKIYENDILVKEYIPCFRKSDNEIGLYETVDDEFLTNGGTDIFSKGPTVTKTAINAKLGDGLDFDSNDAIEVKLGNGLQFDTNGAIESTGEIVNYIAGDGIDISRETVDPDYYFESQVTCSLTGSFSRSFTKTTSEPAFGALITGTPEGQSDHWTGPLFVGKTSTSVGRSQMVTTYSMEYLGETWYYGDFGYFVDGDLTDLNNNLVNLSGVYENTAVGRENAAKALIDVALAGGRDKVVSVVPATTQTLGGIIVGDNLTIDQNGVLSATGGATEYSAGQGIEFETDSETYLFAENLYMLSNTPIDTGIIPSGLYDFHIEIQLKRVGTSGFSIICYNGYAGSFSYQPGYGRSWIYNGHESWIDLYGTTVPSNSICTVDLKWGRNMTMQILPNGTYYSKTTSYDPTNVCHVLLNSSGGNESYVYYVKMWDGDTLVGDLVPCVRQSDNVTGFFNKVDNTFHTNTSGPAIVHGPLTGESYEFVAPTSINAKLGNGLSFDQNDAIQVDQMTGADGSTAGTSGTVPAPTATDNTKFLRGDGSWAEIETSARYVEGDAIEFGHPGMTDLGFDFDTFVSKFTQPNNGTVSVDSTNKAFTLTATGFDCYTNPWAGGALYTIPVIGGRKYRLTWNSNASNVDGTVYAFENANTSHMHGVNQAEQNYLEFTADTSSNVNFRFGVTNSGNSITYSNIKFYEIDNADPDTNIINVKYGNGLSLDNNNALQVDEMVGATSQANGESGTVPQPLIADKDKFLKGDGTWSNPPTYTLPAATASTLGGVKVGAGLSMNANDELGVASPYVTSVANQGSVPGVITVAKSDGTSSDVDVLESLRLILNCNFDSSRIRNPLGEPVNAPSSGDTIGSAIMGDLTVLEVNE